MISESANRLREMINKAIDDQVITPEEYDQILSIANEDGHLDSQEQALLKELQKMIEENAVKFLKK